MTEDEMKAGAAFGDRLRAAIAESDDVPPTIVVRMLGGLLGCAIAAGEGGPEQLHLQALAMAAIASGIMTGEGDEEADECAG